MGKINIFNNDFREVLPSYKEASFDMIFMDPPYLTNFKICQPKARREKAGVKYTSNYSDSFKSRKSRDMLLEFFKESQRLLKKDGILIFFINEKRLNYFMSVANDVGLYFHTFIVWKKNNIINNQFKTKPHKKCEYILIYKKERLEKLPYNDSMDLYDILEFNNVDGNEKNHPNEKPQELLLYFLKLYNFKKQKSFKVLDPFMGGGSLAKACKDFNKFIFDNIEYVGIEKEKEFYNNAKELIESGVHHSIWQQQQKKEKKERNFLTYLENTEG